MSVLTHAALPAVFADRQAFRAVRVLAGDTATGQPTAEYVYLLEDVASFDPVAKGDQSEIKISALAWYQPDC